MKVTFRAAFARPIGKLNPAGWQAPNPPDLNIEVFETGGQWKARCIGPWHASGVTLEKLGKSATHLEHRRIVQEHFIDQRSSWQAYAWTKTAGESKYEICPISEDDIEEQPNGKFKRKLFTHIADPKQTEPGNYFTSRCGQRVHAVQIRSLRSTTEPTCKACLIEWRKEKEQPRI